MRVQLSRWREEAEETGRRIRVRRRCRRVDGVKWAEVQVHGWQSMYKQMAKGKDGVVAIVRGAEEEDARW